MGFVKNKKILWQNIPRTSAIIWYEGIVKIESLSQKLQPKHYKTIFWGCFRGMRSWGFFENKNFLWQNISRTLATICYEGIVKIESLSQKLWPKNHKNQFLDGGVFQGCGVIAVVQK